VNDDKRPSGGKALGFILLAMLVVLAVLVGLATWATRNG
jgi:type II secretory pathway pseudopilin PulG